MIPVVERAIGLFERIGDRRALAALHSTLAFIYGMFGRFAEADALAERAETLMTDEGMRDSLVYAGFLNNRAGLRTEEGRLAEARADVVAAAAIAAGKDRYYFVSRCLPRLMTVELADGNPRRAIELAEEMLASEFGDSKEVRSSALEALTFMHLQLDEVDAAAAAARELLDAAPRDAAPWCHLAAIVALRGETAAAAQLLGFIDALYAQTLLPRRGLERRSYELLRTRLRGLLEESAIVALAADGSLLTTEEAGTIAMRALADPRSAYEL